MNTTMNQGDTLVLVRALRKRRVPYFFSGKIAGALSWRLYALHLLRKKVVTPREAFIFCLPIKSGRGAIIPLVKAKIDEDIRIFLRDFGIDRYSAIAFGAASIAPPTSDVQGWLQLLVLFYEITVLDQYHAKDFLREDSLVIDAGANVGVFSCFAATIATQGIIYAFEPASSTAAVLRKNVAAYKNIHVVETGLGISPGHATLRVKPWESGSSSFEDSGMILDSSTESPIKEETVEITTIDEFVRTNNLARVDFIKIDSEGYEKQILSGARETIQRFRPAIAASAYHHPDDRETMPQLVLSLSKDYDYKLSLRAEEDLIFWPRAK